MILDSITKTCVTIQGASVPLQSIFSFFIELYEHTKIIKQIMLESPFHKSVKPLSQKQTQSHDTIVKIAVTVDIIK